MTKLNAAGDILWNKIFKGINKEITAHFERNILPPLQFTGSKVINRSLFGKDLPCGLARIIFLKKVNGHSKKKTRNSR